ncbi:MAG TPA: hypothetical protein VNA15_05930 [Candidatus Angelobacter sp.]|nr:hypothetical protein [Candidatus Angelobacter sp.]
MTIFELPFWTRWGMEGVAEWQVNAVIASVLIRKFTRRRVVTWTSVAMHLFHGAVLGIVFRLLLLGFLGTAIVSSPVLSYAILFSIVLWIFSPFLTRRFFETSGGFRMTRQGLAVSFFAHIVYGVFLGLLIPVFV